MSLGDTIWRFAASAVKGRKRSSSKTMSIEAILFCRHKFFTAKLYYTLRLISIAGAENREKKKPMVGLYTI
jgi:hypothetical protein